MRYNVERLQQFIISDTGFVFDPGTGEILSTNEVARDIIQCLKEGITDTEAIKTRLLEVYEVDERVLDKDIREFIPMLINLGLISFNLQENRQ